MTYTTYIDPGGYTYLRLSGCVAGGPDATAYHNFIAERLQDGSKAFIVNFMDVELINSVGLSMLVSSLTQVKNAGGYMLLCHIDKVDDILRLTHLGIIFEIFNTEAEACKAVGAPLPEFVAS